MKSKAPKASSVKMSELVLPGDTNNLGNLLGGRLMHWMDLAGAMAAKRHARHSVATVNVDALNFHHPIPKGYMVEICACVVWVGNTSMVTKISVEAENLLTGEKTETNDAYFTFVALDEQGKPVRVPRLQIESEEEEAEYNKVNQQRNS